MIYLYCYRVTYMCNIYVCVYTHVMWICICTCVQIYKYSFNSHTASRGRYCYYAHFINMETKAWRSKAGFSRLRRGKKGRLWLWIRHFESVPSFVLHSTQHAGGSMVRANLMLTEGIRKLYLSSYSSCSFSTATCRAESSGSFSLVWIFQALWALPCCATQTFLRIRSPISLWVWQVPKWWQQLVP